MREYPDNHPRLFNCGDDPEFAATLRAVFEVQIEDALEQARAAHARRRAVLGLDAALAEIERGRGTAYDPAVADACLRLFREKGYTLPKSTMAP